MTANEATDLPIENGFLENGKGSHVEAGAELCHPLKSGERLAVKIGRGATIRSGTVIYSGVTMGDFSQTGHRAVDRENCHIGHDSVIGTGVRCQMDTITGNHVLVETECHITGKMIMEDCEFPDGSVGTAK